MLNVDSTQIRTDNVYDYMNITYETKANNKDPDSTYFNGTVYRTRIKKPPSSHHVQKNIRLPTFTK